MILKPVEIVDEGGGQKIVVLNKTNDEVLQAVANGIPCYVGFNVTTVCGASSVEDLYPLMCPMLDSTHFVYYDGDSDTMKLGTLDVQRSDSTYIYVSTCGDIV